jgi:hypothetical protein
MMACLRDTIPGAALSYALAGSEQLRKGLHLLSERSMTCINIGKPKSRVISIRLSYGEDGRWTWTANRA